MKRHSYLPGGSMIGIHLGMDVHSNLLLMRMLASQLNAYGGRGKDNFGLTAILQGIFKITRTPHSSTQLL